ncbi:MAG: hypothetical protein HYY76_14250 [Acidobacteria bacterium]|nr:hypothetical protein [Acidobacteriota bacterium]
MTRIPTGASLVLLLTALWGPALPAAQQAAPPAAVTLSPEEMERFLLRAEIVRMRSAQGGITNTQRATLSDGVLTHDAQIQSIDEAKPVFRPPAGPAEYNFTDSYRFNIAGYRLARLLDLDNVPMSVERVVNGKKAAVTWWIDDVMMDERTRTKKPVPSPDGERTAMQIHVMRVFDELIQNRDRNLGNLLWTADWKMWMIDHTRAFRTGDFLLNAKLLDRVERSLLQNMRALTYESVSKTAGSSLTKFEIQALLARRDTIVKHFETRIAERGEHTVLYTLRR